MRYKELTPELKEEAFDFFYWFARFEFALKEQTEFRKVRNNRGVEPDWDAFARINTNYQPSPAALRLLELRPKKQVDNNGTLAWEDRYTPNQNNQLQNVVHYLKQVRNNLFHGGKCGDIDYDSIERNRDLIRCSKKILDELAAFADLEGDYRRFY
jgi:hypothetical protein